MFFSTHSSTANHTHSFPPPPPGILVGTLSAGTAGGGLGGLGLQPFLTGQRSLAGAGGLPCARPAHRPPAPRSGARPGHSTRPEQSAEFLEGRRPRQTCLRSLPPSRDARAPQRAAAAPPACAPRPAAAWSASAVRARAGGSARCGPSTWATSSSPARPTPACSPWASGATTASAASPGTRGPCGREGPRGATCAASAEPRPAPQPDLRRPTRVRSSLGSLWSRGLPSCPEMGGSPTP